VNGAIKIDGNGDELTARSHLVTSLVGGRDCSIVACRLLQYATEVPLRLPGVRADNLGCVVSGSRPGIQRIFAARRHR
jgi:hypothetical protein